MKKVRKLLCGIMSAVIILSGVPEMSQNVQAATEKTQTTTQTVKKKNGLYQEGKRRYCYYQNGKKVKTTWKTIKGDKYYFGKSATAFIGPGIVNKKLYLFRANGKLFTRKINGIVSVLGEKYYVYKNGEIRTGWISYKGSIYYAGTLGKIVKNTTYGGVKFNQEGAAKVTPQSQLHIYAQNVLNSVTTSSMTRMEKLRACYNYLAYSGRFYYYSPADPNLSEKSWYIGCANRMLGQGRGNCYGFACAFAALAREIGYTPYLMCARIPGSRDQAADGYTRHCWVMINGEHYDPEGSFAGWGGCFASTYFTTPYKQLTKVKFN